MGREERLGSKLTDLRGVDREGHGVGAGIGVGGSPDGKVGSPGEEMGSPEAETEGIDSSGSPAEEVGEIAGCSVVVDLGRRGKRCRFVARRRTGKLTIDRSVPIRKREFTVRRVPAALEE
jgi:hypothetical protein